MNKDAILLIGAGGLAYAMYRAASGEALPIFDFSKLLDTTTKAQEVDILARTIWGEARGEGANGMQAVANVIVNRANAPSWWGTNIVDVCLKDYQFSVWNQNDPNYRLVTNVTASDPMFKKALEIAARAVAGTLPDITGGATHYHTTAINPSWASSLGVTRVIGAHKFYA
jgi:spore germination cell wall hydrolase CwlJ-like protein